MSNSDNEAVFKAQGVIEGQVRIRAQLTLAKYNLREISEHQGAFDAKLIKSLKNELALLWNESPFEMED